MGKSKKTPKTKEKVSTNKDPKTIVDANSYLSKSPCWVFSHCDETGPWSINNCKDFKNEILQKLVSFEGQKWSEIISSSGGKKKGTNNHFIPISNLAKDAQKRCDDLYLGIDEIFSLRLTGTKRIFGTIQDGIFQLIWYDENHAICPCKK